ncbi:MAG: putative peptidoglycan glycosyltransferase FtsW [Patescibacteria group bacterium]
MSRAKVDKTFLVTTIILIVFGFLIFSSAALGLLARGSANYSSVAFSQTVLGLFLGTVAFLIALRSDYKIWKRNAFYILLAALILNLLIFIPGLGKAHGGALRWLDLGPISFQPAEFLKLAMIIYFAAWSAGVKNKIQEFKYGLLPFLVLIGISSVLLLLQPDTDNLAMIIVALGAMFISAGGKWKHMLIVVLAGLLCFAVLVSMKPYLKQRIVTFMNPQTDSQGAGYQIQQSLIAIGSGGLTGRGFGQSVQKFSFLPEPVGDSIFAVAAEEFGFIGAIFLILLFVIFAMRGLKIASRVPDIFSRLVVVGVVIMITIQAFVNIGAMLGVVPLSGITLPFVSHGGTSLFFTLLGTGIVLSISRTQIKKR